ncbi:MAG TPA: secretion protein HlyD [Cyanobacteria bacterium UBA8543]|nr:secretion protein HlyD [Cyanobacteria bacterium UBA8543]
MFSKLDLDSIHPLKSDDFLPPISRWTTLGGMLLVGTFGAAVALASFIEYNITVRAIAKVRPSGDVQAAVAETGGTVKSVEVRENQIVKKGDVIASINDSRFYSLRNLKSNWERYIQQQKSQLAQRETLLVALDTQIFKESGVATPPAISIQSERSGEINEEVEAALAKIAGSRPDYAEKLASQREALLQFLNDGQQQLKGGLEALQSIEQKISKSEVRAQADGKILTLDIPSPGQPIRSGHQIAQIVPSEAPLVVKARVATEDIGEVKEGQTAQLRVSAYPYPDYGTLLGKVTAIAPDALPCEGKCLDGATSYYEVTIEPDRFYLVKGQSVRDRLNEAGTIQGNANSSTSRQYPIQPGMEVTADIISRRERVITFILNKARLLTDL